MRRHPARRATADDHYVVNLPATRLHEQILYEEPYT